MYVKLNSTQVENFDKYGLPEDLGKKLSELSYNYTTELYTGGSTGTTVTKQAFVAPTKMVIEKVKLLVDTPNVGTSNVPVVTLQKGSTVIATMESPLSGSAGDVITGTLNATPANLILEEGDVLKVVVTTPASTVSTALIGKVTFDWHSVV